MKQKKLKEQSVSLGNVFIHKEDVSIRINKKTIIKWLKELAAEHHREIDQVEYTLMSDEELLKFNIQYLNHDTYTDIITFDLSEDVKINGSILISVDRVKANAKEYNTPQDVELIRVLSHGLLHLIGFKDKSAKDQKRMRLEEEKAIYLYGKFTKFHVK